MKRSETAMSDTLVLSAGHQLRDRAEALADEAVACEFARYPVLRARYGPSGRAKSRADSVCHFASLADSVDVDSPALFNDYVGWLKVLLEHRGVRSEDLAHHLGCMTDALRQQMPAPVADAAVPLIDAALANLSSMPATAPSFLDTGRPLASLARDYLHALLGGYRAAAGRLVLDAAARGEPVRELYLQVFQPALREVGRLWQTNRISVAQEHFCSAATQVVMSQLLSGASAAEQGEHRVVVACVAGDLHDLGARMVGDFFDMGGWNVYFCGASTPHAAVVQTACERDADVLAISASMSCQLHTARELIEQVRADPRCGDVRIMVGGQPFRVDASLWRKVGADGWAPDADAAVTLAAQWMAGSGTA
jgi:methylmalonyl-CoA mutase cobalamin-binding domain/chain